MAWNDNHSGSLAEAYARAIVEAGRRNRDQGLKSAVEMYDRALPSGHPDKGSYWCETCQRAVDARHRFLDESVYI